MKTEHVNVHAYASQCGGKGSHSADYKTHIGLLRKIGYNYTLHIDDVHNRVCMTTPLSRISMDLLTLCKK